MISLNTMVFAVSCDKAPFMRTVRWRTVANTLSIGFVVRKCVQCSAGKSKNVSSASRSLSETFDGIAVFGGEFRRRTLAIAASAAARLGESQISRKSRVRASCSDFGSLSSTLIVMCTQQR